MGKKCWPQPVSISPPVVLELGAKAPVLWDSTADIPLAARRIAWGKSLCAGQTCVAPDYLFVDRKVKGQLVEGIERELHSFFGDRPERNPQYPKLINDAHFERISALLAQGTSSVAAGSTKRRERSPPPSSTSFRRIPSPLTEEVFGPILPVVTYDDPAEILPIWRPGPKPLAPYLLPGIKTESGRSYPGPSSAAGVSMTLSSTSPPRPPLRWRGGQRHGFLPWQSRV